MKSCEKPVNRNAIKVNNYTQFLEKTGLCSNCEEKTPADTRQTNIISHCTIKIYRGYKQINKACYYYYFIYILNRNRRGL